MRKIIVDRVAPGREALRTGIAFSENVRSAGDGSVGDTNVKDLLIVVLFVLVVALFWIFVWWNRE